MEEPIIIMCEEPEAPGRLYLGLDGIAKAKRLRRVEKKRNPIIFVSFLSPQQILARPNTRILSAVGHGYLQIPYTEDELNQAIKLTCALTDIQLADIITNFCGLRSSVRSSFHDFKGELEVIKNTALNEDEARIKYEEKIKLYREELEKDAGDYRDLVEEFDIIRDRYYREGRIEIFKETTEESFIRFLPDEDQGNTSPETIETPERKEKLWKVLFLDDNKAEIKKVFDELDERRINYQVKTTSQEAKVAIENDKSNYFTVVVADYRLYDPNPTAQYRRMQPEQGYDFLVWLSKQIRFNSMIALSGLSRNFLQESFRKNQINIKVYSKNNLTDAGVKLFADELENLGDTQFEALCNQPQKAIHWKTGRITSGHLVSYPLLPYYIYHRSNKAYERNEQTINEKAEQIIRAIESASEDEEDYFPIIDTFGRAQTKMNGTPDRVEEYETFQKKLLYRRIFYFLYLKGIDSKTIARLIHSGSIQPQQEVSDGSIKLTISYLAIQTKSDIPYELLVEEKYFLQHYMNLPIYDIALLMDQSYILINQCIDHYTSGERGAIEREMGRYMHNGIIKTTSINETHIVLEKLVKFIPSAQLLELINSIEDVINKIIIAFPKLSSLKISKSKLINLREIIAKKHFRQ